MIRAWAVAIIFAAQSMLLAATPVCQCSDLSRQPTPACSCPSHAAGEHDCCCSIGAHPNGSDTGSAMVTLPGVQLNALPAETTTAAPPADVHSSALPTPTHVHPLAAHACSRAQRAPPA